MSDYPPLEPDDRMPFGKHEGDPVWEVIQNDHEYITWLMEEASVDFQLDNEAFEIYQAIKVPQ